VPLKLNYLAHLAADSTRFADALAEVPPGTSVPSCPGWDAADLIWHLGEVQWFWSTIVSERASSPEELTAANPVRPKEHDALRSFGRQSSRDLLDTLTQTAPDTVAWTWSAEQTVAFTYRRQAHEALIHRVDAELVAGDRTRINPVLAADGVDEILRIMFDSGPLGTTLTLDPQQTLRVSCTDADDRWLLTLGHYAGTSPKGESLGGPSLKVAEIDSGERTAASVQGKAADLDCWLWGRPPEGQVDFIGDPPTLAAFQATVAGGVH